MAEPVILIVDDEVGVTRLCQRLLDRAGYQVVAVNRPQEGIHFLENEHADLLLVDVRMPEMDGFQLLEISRKLQPDIAVVIMTGYGTVDTAVESLRKGADGMILKPFSGAELVQSIEQALREKQREHEIQRLRVLRPLFDISESLFTEKDPERLQDLFLDIACEHLSCSHISLYLQENDQLKMLGERGLTLSQNVDDFVNQVLDSNSPLLMVDSKSEDPQNQRFLEAHNLGSLICIPVVLGRKSRVVLAGRGIDHIPFNAVDLEMSAVLFRQAAIALENAELYSELQEHILQVERSQRALLQAEKLAAVGRLTASIAHEINNPLQSVRNCLHLIGHGELPEESRKNYLVLATDELDRLMNTAKRMLDYYRPSAIDRQPVDIDDLIHRVVQLMDAQLRNQDVVTHLDLKKGLPVVLAVGNQIQQVLVNIILNALDVMPEGGEIFITSDFQDNHVIILIEDTGPGIHHEEGESIFEPFVSSKEDGLGLGLTVSYGIITAHGGTLELLPQQNRGARFQIRLPEVRTA
jgi:signal transduction histidine kinase/DNA-binding response OmpR family regulator